MTDTLGAARRYGPLGGFQPSTEVLAGTICSPACGSTSGARTLPADRPGVWRLTRFDIVRRVSVLAVTAAGGVRGGEVDGGEAAAFGAPLRSAPAVGRQTRSGMSVPSSPRGSAAVRRPGRW
jgi:hypothetical protein